MIYPAVYTLMKNIKKIKHLDYITALTTLMRLKAHLSILTSWVVFFYGYCLHHPIERNICVLPHC